MMLKMRCVRVRASGFCARITQHIHGLVMHVLALQLTLQYLDDLCANFLEVCSKFVGMHLEVKTHVVNFYIQAAESKG